MPSAKRVADAIDRAFRGESSGIPHHAWLEITGYHLRTKRESKAWPRQTERPPPPFFCLRLGGKWVHFRSTRCGHIWIDSGAKAAFSLGEVFIDIQYCALHPPRTEASLGKKPIAQFVVKTTGGPVHLGVFSDHVPEGDVLAQSIRVEGFEG